MDNYTLSWSSVLPENRKQFRYMAFGDRSGLFIGLFIRWVVTLLTWNNTLMWQLENLPFQTSYIPPGTIRAMDSSYWDLKINGDVGGEFTMIAEGQFQRKSNAFLHFNHVSKIYGIDEPRFESGGLLIERASTNMFKKA